MRNRNLIRWVAISALLFVPACDSGDEEEVNVDFGSFGAPTQISEGNAALDEATAVATAEFQEALVAVGHLTTAPANPSLNYSIAATIPTASGSMQTETVTVSTLVNASGTPQTAGFVYLATSNTGFVVSLESDARLRAIDSESNELILRFNQNLQYQSTQFVQGTGSGRFSSATATAFHDLYSGRQDFLSSVTLSGGLTAKRALAQILGLSVSGKNAQFACPSGVPLLLCGGGPSESFLSARNGVNSSGQGSL